MRFSIAVCASKHSHTFCLCALSVLNGVFTPMKNAILLEAFVLLFASLWAFYEHIHTATTSSILWTLQFPLQTLAFGAFSIIFHPQTLTRERDTEDSGWMAGVLLPPLALISRQIVEGTSGTASFPRNLANKCSQISYSSRMRTVACTSASAFYSIDWVARTVFFAFVYASCSFSTVHSEVLLHSMRIDTKAFDRYHSISSIHCVENLLQSACIRSWHSTTIHHFGRRHSDSTRLHVLPHRFPTACVSSGMSSTTSSMCSDASQ